MTKWSIDPTRPDRKKPRGSTVVPCHFVTPNRLSFRVVLRNDLGAFLQHCHSVIMAAPAIDPKDLELIHNHCGIKEYKAAPTTIDLGGLIVDLL